MSVNRSNSNFEGVFFDLDGTLADTAPDLAAAANKLRLDRHLDPIPFELLRPAASSGARGLLAVAFGIGPEDNNFIELRDEFLFNYENALHVHSYLFDGVESLLNQLEQHNIPWGIVTNKIERFTNPFVKSIGLDKGASVIVSGDTTPTPKPHPAPILLASSLAKVSPEKSLYVGDDQRDIVAGRAAGMKTVAASYGYCGHEDPPEAWGADYLVNTPSALINIIFP
jgi:2-phosphoglycolate phosphatase